MRPLILVGTDDIELYLLLDYVLDAEGFRSMLATSAEEIQDVSSKQAPDAVLLDCRPQSFSCLEVFSGLRQRRETQSIPAIALISSGVGADHVQLLESGIEDAIIRPVSPAKIVERMRLIVVGKGSGLGRKNGALKYADVEMDLTTHRVHRNGKEIHLGPIEYKLLQHLLQAPEQVFSREDLISAAWPDNVYVRLRTVDIHVGRLRKALKSVDKRDLIRTVRSAGYALAGPKGGNSINVKWVKTKTS